MKTKVVFYRRSLLYFLCLIPVAYFANNGGISTAFLSQDGTNALMLALFLIAPMSIITLNLKKIPKRQYAILFYLCMMYLITIPRSGGSIYTSIRYACILMFCFAVFCYPRLIPGTIRLLLFFYVIYAIFTYIEFFFRDYYMNHIYTLFEDKAGILSNSFKSGYMAGLTGHTSSNGMLLSCGLMIVITRYIVSRRRNDLLLSLFFAAALLLTGKRGHFLCMLIAVFGSLFLSFSAHKLGTRIIILMGVLILVVLIGVLVMTMFPALTVVFSRLENILGGEDSSTIIRVRLWKMALDAFRRHPVFGIGWRQFYSSISFRVGSNRNYEVHNVYIQLLSEVGLVGFLLYMGWFVYSLMTAINTYKRMVKAKCSRKDLEYMCFALSMQIFFMTYCITGNPLYDLKMCVPYFFSCGIVHYMKYAFNKQCRILSRQGLS